MYSEKSDEIKLDIDRRWSVRNRLAAFNRTVRVLDFLGMKVLHPPLMTESTNGKIHVAIRLVKEIENWKILAIQCMMGSDWRREAYNLFRLSNGNVENWNVLFKSKAEDETYQIGLEKSESTDEPISTEIKINNIKKVI